MKRQDAVEQLSRRERQVLELICRQDEATVASLLDAIPEPLTDGAVRSILRGLLRKGLVRRSAVGRSVSYRPVASARSLQDGALQRLITTFFRGSRHNAVAAMLGLQRPLTAAEQRRLRQLVDDFRDEAES